MTTGARPTETVGGETRRGRSRDGANRNKRKRFVCSEMASHVTKDVKGEGTNDEKAREWNRAGK